MANIPAVAAFSLKQAQFGLLAAILLTLGGCGNLQGIPKAEVPASVRAQAIQLSSDRPNKDIVAPKGYEVPQQSIYLVQKSGSSLTAGLLFGPIGMLANNANMDRITNEMGQSAQGSSILGLDALKEAQTAWGNSVNSTADASTAIMLKPYIVLHIAEDKPAIHTAVGVRAEGNVPTEGGGTKLWAGHYNYLIESVQSAELLSKKMSEPELAQYRNALHNGFKEIKAEIQKDLSSEAPPKRQIAWVKSPYFSNVDPRANIGAHGDIELDSNGRLALRSNWIHGSDTRAISYIVSVFPSKTQYVFDNGPVDRESK